MKKLLLTLSLFSVGFVSNAQSWVSQATGFTEVSRGLQEIHITDANTVWGLAFDGSATAANIQEFTRTTDGGTTWTPGIIDIGNPALVIGNLSAIDANTAWVSAFDETNGQGLIGRTIDGGASWEVQTGTEFTSATSWCDGVHFFNANNGIAFGDPATSTATTFEVYRTTDGGNTWIPVTTPTITAGDFGYAGSFAAAGNTFWFTTARGKLYRTTDMGVTWTKLNSPLTDFGGVNTPSNSGRAYFSNNNIGVILGSTNANATSPTYKIWKTTDGGTTWDAGTTYTGFRLLCYIPGTTTLVATSASTTPGVGSAYSNDNGVNWTTIESGTDQRGVPAFFDGSTGWCGSYSTDQVTDGVFKFSGNLGSQAFVANSFKVYPNPATSAVTISAKESDSYKVKVTDLAGKVMMVKEFNGMENTIDVSGFATGVYFFEINSGSKSETIKIMKN